MRCESTNVIVAMRSLGVRSAIAYKCRLGLQPMSDGFLKIHFSWLANLFVSHNPREWDNNYKVVSVEWSTHYKEVQG